MGDLNVEKSKQGYAGPVSVFKSHIPTTKGEIEALVQFFYQQIERKAFHEQVARNSKHGPFKFFLTGELYETDFTEIEEEERYMDDLDPHQDVVQPHPDQMLTPSPQPFPAFASSEGNQRLRSHSPSVSNQQDHQSMESMTQEFKELLDDFIVDIEKRFDFLMA